MWGVGFSEMLFIAAIALIVLGPQRLPILFKSLGRAMREFRRATRELRSQVGIDEMMAEEDRAPPPQWRRPPPGFAAADSATAESTAREYPVEGVDVAESRRAGKAP